jgi:serine/threonine-protein kinase
MRDVRSCPELLDLQEAVAGRYSVDHEIGRGGMGIVALARDVALDRPVAIKLFPPDLARQPVLRERFLNEARTAARLSHPNIVPIHAVEEHGDLVFFVMAYIEGQTLTQRIASRGPLPVREAVQALRQIAWALAHAHSQGVVHRDIKPDNIMLEHGTDRVLVTDFGIALAGRASDRDDPDRVIGTPEFMSPEQVRGGEVDGRSDLYSFGLVAFYALSGRYPYPSGTPAEAMAHHLSTPPSRLQTVAPGVPAKLGDVIDRCLVKALDDRVESAADLAERLGAALEERRHAPVPVRHFVEELKRRGTRSPFWVYVMLGVWLTPMMASVLVYPSSSVLLGSVAPLLLVGGVASLSLGLLLPRVRRVLRAGYGRDDVVQALLQDIEARQEELAYLYGERYREDAARLRRLAYGGFAVALALSTGVATMVLPYSATLIGGSIAAGAVGAIAGVRAIKRSDKKARQRWRLWKGTIGEWLFRIAGVGIKRVALPSTALTARPTEVALGAAVLGLYDALSPEAQRALPDLQQVVAGLEDDAHRMRRLVDDCTAVLTAIETASGDTAARPPGADARAAHVCGLRDRAKERMQQAVAALETLRVDLLRLSAGTAEIGSVTTRLGSARQVAADIARLLDAQEEVDRLLSP